MTSAEGPEGALEREYKMPPSPVYHNVFQTPSPVDKEKKEQDNNVPRTSRIIAPETMLNYYFMTFTYYITLFRNLHYIIPLLHGGNCLLRRVKGSNKSPPHGGVICSTEDQGPKPRAAGVADDIPGACSRSLYGSD